MSAGWQQLVVWPQLDDHALLQAAPPCCPTSVMERCHPRQSDCKSPQQPRQRHGRPPQAGRRPIAAHSVSQCLVYLIPAGSQLKLNGSHLKLTVSLRGQFAVKCQSQPDISVRTHECIGETAGSLSISCSSRFDTKQSAHADIVCIAETTTAKQPARQQ